MLFLSSMHSSEMEKTLELMGRFWGRSFLRVPSMVLDNAADDEVDLSSFAMELVHVKSR